MKPRPRLGLPALRAWELLDAAYVARTGVTPKAVVRQARRVARSATRLLGGKFRYPAGVVIYMSPSLPARVQNDLYDLGSDRIAHEIAKPLRSSGKAPRLYVRLEPDDTMNRPFEVAVLERDHNIAGQPASGVEAIPPQLALDVIRRWQALEDVSPKNGDMIDLQWLEARTDLPYKQLDAARHTRNRLAHPKDADHGVHAGRNGPASAPPLTYDRVVTAHQTLRTAYERLQSQDHDHSDRPPAGR